MSKRTAAMRVLGCVAVLVLVGVTALAVGSKKAGFVTANGGRMTIALRGPMPTYTPADSGDATLSTIFSNLGTGGNVYNCCTGWTISAVGSIIGQQNWIGEAFTPANDATVKKIKVAVGYVTGVNGVTVGLYADKAGVPGKELEKWNKKNLPGFGTCCTLVVAKDDAGIPVTGGTQYWVVVKTSGKTPDTWDAFNWSNSGVGTLANNTGSGWVNLGTTTQAAFAVLGN